jgi:sortase A
MSRRQARVLFLGLVVLAAGFGAAASWIHVKAWLAQRLLHRAWAATQAEGVPVKPWPWADTWPIARLVVPSLGIDQIVLEGAYGRTLAFGPGHAESTGPLEGSYTIILTGHRDTHFRFLEKLQAGETILIQARTGVWHRFAVRDRQIVDSRTAIISTQEDKRHLILVTCYPFHPIVPGGPLRYTVFAEIVERMAED